MSLNKKSFDVVIYGATGFTGQLVAEYFAKNVNINIVKWAIAGRNENKLLQVKDKLMSIQDQLKDLDVIQADTEDENSLEQMALSTKVVISTVGPYLLHGEPVVKACISGRAHCLDLSGEPEYVHHIYKHYNFPAERAGVMIINSCGFDSVPADLGAFYTAQLLKSDGVKSIQSYVTANGTFSGGTLKSALGIMEKFSEDMLWDPTYKFGKAEAPVLHYNQDVKKWGVPMPVVDPEIVKRSSRDRKDIFGENFSYAQYFGTSYPWNAGGIVFGVGALILASKVEPIKNQILKWKPSGDGPSESERERSNFKLYFVGTSSNQKVLTTVSGGDPGYTETSKMISEAALTIIENLKLYENCGGVKTPAGVLGEIYLEKLQQKGIVFKTIKASLNS